MQWYSWDRWDDTCRTDQTPSHVSLKISATSPSVVLLGLCHQRNGSLWKCGYIQLRDLDAFEAHMATSHLGGMREVIISGLLSSEYLWCDVTVLIAVLHSCNSHQVKQTYDGIVVCQKSQQQSWMGMDLSRRDKNTTIRRLDIHVRWNQYVPFGQPPPPFDSIFISFCCNRFGITIQLGYKKCFVFCLISKASKLQISQNFNCNKWMISNLSATWSTAGSFWYTEGLKSGGKRVKHGNKKKTFSWSGLWITVANYSISHLPSKWTRLKTRDLSVHLWTFSTV